MKFDYTLTSPEERTAYVEQLLKDTPPDKINNKVLGYMSDYILFVADKNQTKKEKEQEHCIIDKFRPLHFDDARFFKRFQKRVLILAVSDKGKFFHINDCHIL